MVTAVSGSVTSGEDAAEQVALSGESVTRDRSYLIVAAEQFLIYEQGHHVVRLFNPVQCVAQESLCHCH